MYKWRTMRRHARSNNSLESLTTPSGDFFFLSRCSNFSITLPSPPMETFIFSFFFFFFSNTFTLNILFQYNAYPRVCIIIAVKKRFETKGKRSKRCKLPFRVFVLFFFFYLLHMYAAMNNEIGIGENLVRIDHLTVFV